MNDNLVDPSEPPEAQIARLKAIADALMRRVEMQTDRDGAAYAQFERAAMLEEQVRRRTGELERALQLLNESNAKLSAANHQIEAARRDLASAIEAVQEGFALFGVDDVLLLFNGRFCWQLPEVRARLRPGLTFAEYIHIVADSKMLQLPEHVTPESWAANRIRRHGTDHVIFNLALKGERWLQVSEHRTANSGTAIVHTDVTDLMRTEREQRDRLLDHQSRIARAVLDHLNQGVAIFDAERRLVGWNNRFNLLTGLPPHTFSLGTPFSHMADQILQRFRLEQGGTRQKLVQRMRAKGPHEPLMFELLQQGGTRILDCFTQRLPDDSFIVTFTDITAERDAARRLARTNEELEARVAARTEQMQDALLRAERSNASKSRFVAAASHDLLQPLSAAKLYLSAAEAAGEHPNVRKAGEALTNVERIIEALLDISRLETEEEAFERVDLPLGGIFTALDHACAPMAAAKGLRFRIRPCHETVLSDPMYLQRIMQNLISNAIRYTESGGVLVGARRRGNRLRIEVWDSGIGISDEDRPVIFEEFRRLKRRASASEGMGLGLAIVERACARLGHRIDLSSRPGRGSVFRVTVDLSSQQGGSLPAPPGPARQARPSLASAGLLVLLVDNDEQLRHALVGLLEGWGVSVLEAAGPDEAMALLDEMDITPDAMLIDYQLDHGANGLDLAARLQQRHGPRPMRIISADRSDGLREGCAALGLGLMPKPLDTQALFNFLAAVAPAPGRFAPDS